MSKKISKIGYVWKCDLPKILIEKNECINFSKEYALAATKETLLDEASCSCGKYCKPIKVRITIEEV